MASKRRVAAFAGVVLATCHALGVADEAATAARVGALLKEWSEAPTTSRDLEERLVALGRDATPQMTRLLDAPHAEDDPLPVDALARALARSAQHDGVACLSRLAHSPRPADRAAAVVALAEVPAPDAMAIVLDALKSEAIEVAAAAAASVVSVAERDPARAPDDATVRTLRDAPNRDVIGGLLGRLGTPAAHDTLLHLLGRSDPATQAAAMDGLWDAAADRDCDQVRSFLGSRRPVSIRKKAALLLGHLHDVESIPELIEALKEDDVGLVADARWALCEITGQRLDDDPELWSDWWSRGGEEEMAKRAADASAQGDEPATTADATRAREADDADRAEDPVLASVASASRLPWYVGVGALVLSAASIAIARRRFVRAEPGSRPQLPIRQ